jgi:maleate isomerase
MSEPGGRVRIGVLTPSSNTALEPLSSAILHGLPEVSLHAARLPVTAIGLGDAALAQFDHEPFLAAARLLADARVDVLLWSGTSGGWLGLDADEQLCAALTEATGIPATTSTLALEQVLLRTGRRDVALVTPYTDDVQAAIVASLERRGLSVRSRRNLGLSVNWEFCTVAAPELTAMIRDVAAIGPAAIGTFCTNLWAAQLVAGWEREFGIPVYDTVSLGIWAALAMTPVDPARITGWGSLFQVAP